MTYRAALNINLYFVICFKLKWDLPLLALRQLSWDTQIVLKIQTFFAHQIIFFHTHIESYRLRNLLH